MSRDFWLVLLVAVATTLLVFAPWRPVSPERRQQENLQRAAERVPEVQSLLDADPRFHEVCTGVYTGQDGALWLTGRVETADDLFRLMRAVAAKQLPVAVRWQVAVLAEEQER